MGSTYLSLSYHLVWSTKDRMNWINPQWEKRLHGFLAKSIEQIGGIPHLINGTSDHLHLLVSLKATHCLADVVGDIKRGSSRWVHSTLKTPLFGWQDGYAAFTVGASQLAAVKNYVAKQKQHHAKKSSVEELVEILKKAGIEYDPEYLE